MCQLTSIDVKTPLIVLLVAYYIFLTISFLVDRQLLARCRATGLVKPAFFVVATYVDGPVFSRFMSALKTRPDMTGFRRWLRLWQVVSLLFGSVMVALLIVGTVFLFRCPLPSTSPA